MVDIPSDDVVYDPYKHIEPCPFCGCPCIIERDPGPKEPVFVVFYHDDQYTPTYRVRCPACNIATPWLTEKVDALLKWNKRVSN